MLACCIYGHFLSSLNRAGCAGNLGSLLQMVCIMFKPPCHHPSLSLSPSPSLPFPINHQNLKLYVFEEGGGGGEKREKKQEEDIRKGRKLLLGSLYTFKQATALIPSTPRRPSAGLPSPLCPGHGALISGRVDFPSSRIQHVKHLISRAGGLAGAFFPPSSSQSKTPESW